MKFFSLTKYFLYSIEKRTSKNQIKEDFGDFPPIPLNCANLDREFILVKTRGFGDTYNWLVITKRLLHAASVDSNLISVEFFQHTGISRTLSFVKFLLLSPLVFYGLTKMGRNKKRGIGLFLPILRDEKQITIRLDANKNNRNIASIISHEHIHLLQSRSSEKHNRDIKHLDFLISNKYQTEKSLLYFLERHETEARLHESILSYYRVSGELPLTIEGFLMLLAGSSILGISVIEALTTNGIAVKPDIIEYHEREPMNADEIYSIFFAIKDVNLRYKFITEVLTVMYGNMINYYGDKESSLRFLKQIERPNLYDLMYIHGDA